MLGPSYSVVKSGTWVSWMQFGLGPESERMPVTGSRERQEYFAHAHWGTHGVGQVPCTHEIYMEIGFYERGPEQERGSRGAEGRHDLYSISIDGFAMSGGFYHPTEDDPKRHEWQLDDPQQTGEGTVLIMAQRDVDQALAGSDHGQWLRDKVEQYGKDSVVIRKHPTFPLPEDFDTTGLQLDNMTGDGALHRALNHYRPELVVAYSSSATIKAFAAGWPTVCDHEFGFVQPGMTMEDRPQWMRNLSYRIWTAEECKRGAFAPYLRRYLEIPEPPLDERGDVDATSKWYEVYGR